MKLTSTFVVSIWVGLLLAQNASAQISISVDPNSVVATRSGTPLGVVLNQLVDGTLSLDSLKSAVSQSGSKHLRFPEGESADNYYFTDPANISSPNPATHRVANTAWWPTNTAIADSTGHFKKGLNFDQFMSVVNSTGAVANVVLCYPCTDKAMALKMAKAWVKYAMDKGYNVPYWEIGNETYAFNNNYTETYQMTVAEYAKDVIEWSAALKAINPNIKIGANGLSKEWLTSLLTYKHPTLGKYGSQAIDFLAVHSYEIYQSTFANYQLNKNSWGVVDFAANANKAVAAITAAASYPNAANIRIQITECSTMNYSASDINNFGQAIMTMDMLTEMLKVPKVDYIEQWASHWYKTWTTSTPLGSDMFSATNQLNLSGVAQSILAKFLGDKTISVSGATSTLRAFASQSSATGAISLILINRSNSAQAINFSIKNQTGSLSALQYTMTGTGPADLKPVFTSTGTPVGSNSATINVNVPAVSFMILNVGAAQPNPTPTPTPTPAPSPSPVPIATNLVTNPDFESGLTGWADWKNAVLSTSSPIGGAYSLRIGTAEGGRAQNISGLSPGKAYTFRFKAKVSASGQDAWVAASFKDASGNTITGYSFSTKVTSLTATQTELTITAPPSFSYVQVWAWKGAGTGYLYVDDFYLGLK